MATKKTKKTPFNTKDVIGLSLDDAITLIKTSNLLVRIKSVDGVAQMGTCDARGDRVNLTIVKNKVKKAEIG